MWKCSKTHYNYNALYLLYGGVSFPLKFVASYCKKGNVTQERKSMMDGDTVSLWSHNIKIVTVTLTKSKAAKTSVGLKNGCFLQSGALQ